MKIGITERGDAAYGIAKWRTALECKNVDGAILITKNLTKAFTDAVLNCYFDPVGNTKNIIVHATCTGWGKSVFEPNVPDYQRQINCLRNLVNNGFPIEHCVLRIDPIVPTESGLNVACKVLDYAWEQGLLPQMRVRISVYDEYKHVKERLHKNGFASVYPGNQFYASKEQFAYVTERLKKYDIQFHTCAEPFLKDPDDTGLYVHSGCISPIDLRILGFDTPVISVNPQHRTGCLCLSCKTELLDKRHPCPHNCMYCFWKD